MVDRMNLKRIIGLFLVFVVIGSAACALESKVEGPAVLRDQTGERWDISQARKLGFKADGFQYGIGRNAFKPLDNNDLSTDTSSVPSSERVIGIANQHEAHAYSVRKLSRHEIANTLLGEVPVSAGY